MCKTGKKIKKINFNKFIWLYWKMKKKKKKKYIYIYIYIFFFFFSFGGFPVAEMREKKKCVGKLGYCPSSNFGS